MEMSNSYDAYKARQAEIKATILEEPAEYFRRGYNIGEYCLINAPKMLKEDIFCFAKAWSPFCITSNNDRNNIVSLRITLCMMIRLSHRALGDNAIFKIIDSYPFVLDELDIEFRISKSLLERYKMRNASIAAFIQTEFALLLPQEIVDMITDMC